MKAEQFYSRYFGRKAIGGSQIDKKIVHFWTPEASLFNNFTGSGLLFFYAASPELKTEIVVTFYNTESQSNQFFSRVAYANDIDSTNDIITAVLQAMRKPFKKAIKGDLTDEEILSLCQEKEVVRVLSVTDEDKK